jgi:hypothetical protein
LVRFVVKARERDILPLLMRAADMAIDSCR